MLQLTVVAVVAIERRFTEHLSPSSRGKGEFAAAYSTQDRKVWASAGLPNSQKLAEALQDYRITYVALDVRQLIKNALGLATVLGDRFSLYYLCFESCGGRSDRHRLEILTSTALVGEEVRFRSLTYQEVYTRILQAGTTGADYVNYLAYLGTRYFPEEMIE